MSRVLRPGWRLWVLGAAAALALAGPGPVLGADKGSGAPAAFAVAAVHMEQNATDGDFEVVFEVKGGKEGLARLTVVAPGGRTVIDFTAPEASASLGMRQFRFETPEPRDAKALASAYPEGVYTFTGTTATGGKLRGKATLSHRLPAATSFLQPKGNARGVDATKKISWTPVESAAAYIVKIEQRKLGVSLTSTLPGSVAALGVPEGFLRPGTEYQLAIGTVSDRGNISFVETTFTTGGRE
jgi:hypothetical protein